MSKLKCSETFIYDAYVLYYNKLDLKELEILKEFLSDTKSNITKLINECKHSPVESILIIDSVGFETKVLGDNINTTSNNVITGGNKPFTIEFYALIMFFALIHEFRTYFCRITFKIKTKEIKYNAIWTSSNI